MTRPTSGAGPGNSSGPVVTRATTNELELTNHLSTTVPQPKDSPAHRRLALHHLLVRRRRWSVELDELLADLEGKPSEGEGFDDEFVHVDYHRDHLDRTLAEREQIGREMAAAGWRP